MSLYDDELTAAATTALLLPAVDQAVGVCAAPAVDSTPPLEEELGTGTAAEEELLPWDEVTDEEWLSSWLAADS